MKPIPLPEASDAMPSLKKHAEIKVALIQQICPSYRVRFFEMLSKRLAENGFKLTVFFGMPRKGLAYSGMIPDPRLSGFKFAYKILPKIGYEGKLPTSPFHFKRSFIIFPTLIFEVGNKRFDITISDTTGLLLNTFPLLIVNKFLLGKKFVIWCGGNIKDNAPRPNDNIIKKIAYVFAGLMYKHCDASIVYGPASRRFDIYMGTHPSKIFIALNTVDTLYFEEAIRERKNEVEHLQEKLGVQGKKCVLYVGVMEKRKKLENLILAFGNLKKSINGAALLLVGDGPHREILQDLSTKEKIKDIYYVGKVSYDNIPLFYALCDVFVLPAQGGIAVAEAMACGKPVIITEECNALRSIPGLVRNSENGFILKEDDIPSLVEHMRKILCDPVLARKMGAESKNIIDKHFSAAMMVQGFERALSYVVANTRS